MEKNKVRSFTDLIVWQKSHQLFLLTASDVEGFPKTITARIVADQIIRSVSSISTNIAEGFGRKMGKEYIHYLIIARGSTTESINWYLKCKDLHYLPETTITERLLLLEEVLKMLNKMISQKVRLNL